MKDQLEWIEYIKWNITFIQFNFLYFISKMRTLFVRLALALALASVNGQNGAEVGSGRPHIIIIMADDLVIPRADYIIIYWDADICFARALMMLAFEAQISFSLRILMHWPIVGWSSITCTHRRCVRQAEQHCWPENTL